MRTGFLCSKTWVRSPPAARKICWSEQASLHVICRNDMIRVRRPSDWDFNWRPPVQGQSSPVQVKDPYTGSILMHVGSSCKHTRVYNVLIGVTRKHQRTIGPENPHLKPDPGVLSHHEMTLTLNTHTPLLNS